MSQAPTGTTASPAKEWKWTYGNGWTLKAWFDADKIKVQWQHETDGTNAQALFIYLDDGPECLASLASFVEAMRRWRSAPAGSSGP